MYQIVKAAGLIGHLETANMDNFGGEFEVRKAGIKIYFYDK